MSIKLKGFILFSRAEFDENMRHDCTLGEVRRAAVRLCQHLYILHSGVHFACRRSFEV